MEKRILFSTTIVDLKTRQVNLKKEAIKKATLQTWIADSLKEISDLNLTKKQIHDFANDFLQPNGYTFTKEFQTEYFNYKFLVEEIDLIN